MSLTYAPHIVYTLALISTSTHLLWHRKAVEEQQAQLGAQLTVLESLAGRLRTGERVSLAEIERMKRLARAQEGVPAESVFDQRRGSLLNEEVGWRDVFLGRRRPLDTVMNRSQEYEQKDWESLRDAVREEK